jgi:WD40 repeat protein
MRMRARLFGHAGWIQAITFRNDDGSILASIDDDTVRVWNVLTGDCLHRFSVRIAFFGFFFLHIFLDCQ